MKRIYMDHAATTPVDPEVVMAMLPFYENTFGNASSLHSFGRESKMALEDSRVTVAELINCEKDEIIFTAGGTESDNIAILGVAENFSHYIDEHPGGPHIITTPIEHPAVLNSCKYLEKQGFKVMYLPVDRYGLIDLNELEGSITPSTFLITIIYGNNEIGTIQPMEEIGAVARKNGVIFHTDAVQAFGKVPIDVGKEKIDMLSASSHKIYGPKGVGTLYIKKGIRLKPMIHGGGHEKGLRPSTENIPGIVGFAKAVELAKLRMDEDICSQTELRDRLIKGVLEQIPESGLNGHPINRLPNNTNFRFKAIEGEALILSLDNQGIATSTGSACSSKKSEASHTLLALGLNPVDAQGSLRLTLGRDTTREDIDSVLELLPVVIAKLRDISPLWGKELDLEKWTRDLHRD